MLNSTGMVRSLIASQQKLSKRFDAILPARFTIDGNQDFSRIASAMLGPDMAVWDIGGGKHPFLSLDLKRRFNLQVTGLDISAQELAGAPIGAYDRTVVADITQFRGSNDADLVICQALMEHVPDTAAAFAAIATILKTGGRAVIFTPSRNATFARLNLIVPQGLKERLLFAIYPQARGHQGFPAYYNRCTPREFQGLVRVSGLNILNQHLYYQSDYFGFAFPLHLIWRAWVLLFSSLAPESAAETFTLTLVKGPS